MSIIQEYRVTQQALNDLESKLSSMASDERLQRELALADKFNALIAETGFSLKEALRILSPDQASNQAVKTVRTRAPRIESIYKNPFSGETVITKGGNHKVIKAWKLQYGEDKVKSWKVT